MALEWVILAYTASAEAVMLLFLTLPGLGFLRRGLIAVSRNALKPLMSAVPLCFFMLLDIYWKYETKMTLCEDHENCSPIEHLHHEKSMIKMERNLILIGAVLLLYWLLFAVTQLAIRLERLSQQVKKLKSSN